MIPSTASPSSHFSLSHKAADLLRVLHDLKGSSPAVREALIADSQGLPLVSTFTDQELESSLAAMMIVMLSDSTRSLREMYLGDLTNVVVTGETGYLLFRSLGPSAGIAFVISHDVAWSELIAKINWTVMEIHLIARTPLFTPT